MCEINTSHASQGSGSKTIPTLGGNLIGLVEFNPICLYLTKSLYKLVREVNRGHDPSMRRLVLHYCNVPYRN
jgi:hypothetical protein